MEKLPEVASFEKNEEKPVRLNKLRMISGNEIDISTCEVTERIVQSSLENAVFSFKDTKSLTFFKGLKCKAAIEKHIGAANMEMFVKTVKIMKIFTKGKC